MDKIEVGEVFTITDENDQENEVEVLGIMDVEGTDYVAVAFVEEIQEGTDEDDIDIFFLRVDEDGDFGTIESDEEFSKVSTAFEEVVEALEE